MNADPIAAAAAKKQTDKENYEEERAKFERVKIQMELEKVDPITFLSSLVHSPFHVEMIPCFIWK
jgi:hypothetical protein